MHVRANVSVLPPSMYERKGGKGEKKPERDVSAARRQISESILLMHPACSFLFACAILLATVMALDGWLAQSHTWCSYAPSLIPRGPPKYSRHQPQSKIQSTTPYASNGSDHHLFRETNNVTFVSMHLCVCCLVCAPSILDACSHTNTASCSVARHPVDLALFSLIDGPDLR